MNTILLTNAKNDLAGLVEEANLSERPVKLKLRGLAASAVLLSENNWRAIKETLYLVAQPGLRASIKKGLATPVAKCSRKLKW